MLEEEGAVIVGLLVGLNVIDANLCVKGEDLDSQVTTALRLYLDHLTTHLHQTWHVNVVLMWVCYLNLIMW